MPKPRTPAVETIDRALKARTVEATLYERLDGGKVRCFACGHRCTVLDGLDGICRVRFNRGGILFAPRGYVGGLQIDPIEKKPFFHVFPGADALSFGMLGCDLHCDYCQNWLTSQALRDPAALTPAQDVDAASLVRSAIDHGAPVVVSTYNEPLITAEWAFEVFSAAKEAGLVCGFVSNGNATPEVLDYLRPVTDLYKVDLKGFRDEAYRTLGGKLKTVLDTIGNLHARGFWVEIVTLLIPGFNDAEEDLRGMTRFLAGISPDLPWHVTAFHRDYKRTGGRDTAADDLKRAADIARDSGLRYVYAGNRAGQVGDLENTRCPSCDALLVERRGYTILSVPIGRDGKCPSCAQVIPGRWERATLRAGAPRRLRAWGAS